MIIQIFEAQIHPKKKKSLSMSLTPVSRTAWSSSNNLMFCSIQVTPFDHGDFGGCSQGWIVGTPSVPTDEWIWPLGRWWKWLCDWAKHCPLRVISVWLVRQRWLYSFKVPPWPRDLEQWCVCWETLSHLLWWSNLQVCRAWIFNQGPVSTVTLSARLLWLKTQWWLIPHPEQERTNN